ncbi:mucin-2-like [Penaeus monodon]|uniref:mucin-2-like n=1 Tax=Penaeus monodon TaxID=6687 RepID=UPI0018A6DB7D|nr:mucin-2-like [Penaeus monodon]
MSQPGSRPPTPEDAGPQDELPPGPDPRLAPARSAMALGGALSDSGTAGLEMQQSTGGDQLARMQAQMQMQMQAQIQVLATLLKGQQPTPSTVADENLPAADAVLPPSLSTIQTCREEATGQQPRLPPSVPVGPQSTAFVASYLTSAVDNQPVRDGRDVTGPQQMVTPTPAVVSAPSPPTLSGTEAATQPRPPVLPQPTQYGPPPQYTAPVLQPLSISTPTHPAAADGTPVSSSQSWPVQPCDRACSCSTLTSGRDEVPVFCGETPVSQGIQWSPGFPASSSQPGLPPPRLTSAWRVASIQDWVSFKARLWDQFRGIATAQHFYDMLAQARMAVGQGPLDFFRAVELAVQQGLRDYPQDIGNTEGLMQRIRVT